MCDTQCNWVKYFYTHQHTTLPKATKYFILFLHFANQIHAYLPQQSGYKEIINFCGCISQDRIVTRGELEQMENRRAHFKLLHSPPHTFLFGLRSCDCPSPKAQGGSHCSRSHQSPHGRFSAGTNSLKQENIINPLDPDDVAVTSWKYLSQGASDRNMPS